LASDGDDHKKVEVLDPLPPDGAGGTADVLAIISNYTERPDLLLEVVEKHDPGFIKRMNQNAEKYAEEFRQSRFRFGRSQAYATLAVQVIAALAILFFIWTALDQKLLNFWMLLGFAVIYAVAQGGRSGFLEIARGLASLLGHKGNEKPKDD
jgi:hypothetical protein